MDGTAQGKNIATIFACLPSRGNAMAGLASTVRPPLNAAVMLFARGLPPPHVIVACK